MSGPVSAWTCAACGTRYAVPSLATECRERHYEQAVEGADDED